MKRVEEAKLDRMERCYEIMNTPLIVQAWRFFFPRTDEGYSERPAGHALYRPDTVGWHADPLGHYPSRWWDGPVWTDRVRNGLDETTDPAPSRFPSLVHKDPS